MKRFILLLLITAFVTACSQYTCPTYTKQDSGKPSSERRI
ncbi:MAG: lipoprotein [Cyclobacteriaceae bacterium]|nr:lipoprotein [Cyclobacteriaceae bacterium]